MDKIEGTVDRLSALVVVPRTVLRNASIQDYVATGFHAFMLAKALGAPNGDEADLARLGGLLLLLMTLTTVLLVRGELLAAGRCRAAIYRVGLFLPMALSYFEMSVLLPALHPASADSTLLAIDEALLGVTPAVWLERFNEPWIIEWFSFFYYGYFFILAGVLIPGLVAEKGRRLQELTVGALLVACMGHIGYTLVPALGPYATMSFEAPVDGRAFWGLVQSTVAGAGAGWDVFPSLHTAYPTFFALHAFGNRIRTWPLSAYFAANIVVATMLLRWHYGIDIVAGLALALAARQLSVWVASREQARADEGRQPVWEPLTAVATEGPPEVEGRA